MLRVLFLIPNLGHGGAEKVLVNLVNHMDYNKFNITVMALYDEGVNRDMLNSHIRYRACFNKSFPGIAHILKLRSPRQLYRYLVKEKYDIVVSYLEGQTARIVSGCTDADAKKVAWIHVEQHTQSVAAKLFRSVNEMIECYQTYDQFVCVSQSVKDDFMSLVPVKNVDVLYNTVESDVIRLKAEEELNDSTVFQNDDIKICAVGTLKPSKGFERLIKIHRKLRADGYHVHTYILGEGPDERKLKKQTEVEGCADSVSFLGYQTNPYQYVRRCDLFVCSSLAEGFSTAATEALIVGTPVCSVEVSGMREMLGEHNEYGVIVKNDDTALYQGLKGLLDEPERLSFYKQRAILRGNKFSAEETVSPVEEMFIRLAGI